MGSGGSQSDVQCSRLERTHGILSAHSSPARTHLGGISRLGGQAEMSVLLHAYREHRPTAQKSANERDQRHFLFCYLETSFWRSPSLEFFVTTGSTSWPCLVKRWDLCAVLPWVCFLAFSFLTAITLPFWKRRGKKLVWEAAESRRASWKSWDANQNHSISLASVFVSVRWAPFSTRGSVSTVTSLWWAYNRQHFWG